MPESSVLQVFVFKAGQYVGSEVFTEEEIVIGSGSGVDLALDDEEVAANHAILSHANDQATLLDLGAPGGTQINRTAIQHSYVTPRDEIQIGSHTLKIKFMTSKKTKQAALSQPAALATDLKGDEPTQIQRPDSNKKKGQFQISTEVIPKEPQGASIDDLLDGELRRFQEITASIEISGSDVVAARPVSGVDTPKRPQRTAKLPDSKPAPKSDAGPTGPIRVPPPARANTPVVDDLHGPPTQPVFQPPAATPIQTPIARIVPPDAEASPIAPMDTADLDADEIDEWTRPGFSLIGKLREAERSVRQGNALEVIGFSDDDVRAAELLAKKGERFVLGRGKHAEAPDAGYPGLKIAQLVGEGTAEIQFPTAAAGWIETQGKRTQLDTLKVPQNAVSKKGDAFRTTLNRGSTAVIQFGGTGYYFRFVEPPPMRDEAFKISVDRTIAKAIASSFVVHLLVLVVVALFSEGVSYSDVPREEWAEIQQDDLRDVEVKPPEPEPEPEPEPVAEEPAPEPEPEPEPEPKPERKPPKRKAPAPKGFTKEEVKTAGVLGAMGKLNLKAPGKKSMVAAVSNIDAVRAPGGSNFRVGALVGKLPSSQVSVGGGGGGKLLTRGGAALLKGGTGFAQIGKSGAKVRGRVDRINSTRLVSKGSISREEVAAVINKHLGEVHYCYETTLMKDPGLQGKLVLEWVINANGSVGKVKQKTSTLKNPGVASCIMDRLRRWQFPKPRGGVVIVSYPFIFSPVGF
jgi:hypothetical protein